MAAKSGEVVEQALAGHIARDEETRRRLLELVHPFAPTVTDTFGVSAALSRALNLDERLSTARVKLEGGQNPGRQPAPARGGLRRDGRGAPL